MSSWGAPVENPAAGKRPIWSGERWLALAGPVVLYLGITLYGAMLPQAALAFICIWAGLVAIGLSRPKLRNDLTRLDGIALPAGLFAAVIFVAAWSLTPWVPGGPHPVWKYLGLASGAATVDKSQTLIEIFKLLGLSVVFTAGAVTGRSDDRARTAISATLALGAAYAAWTFLAFVAERQAGTRLEATVQSANTAGTIFASLFLLSIGPLMSRLRSDTPQKLTAAAPYGTAALLFLVCLFTTASQGAFFAALCGLVAIGALTVFGTRIRLSRAVLIGGILLIGLTGLLALTGDLLLSRLFGAHETVASRADIADAHWRAFETSPLMGFGLGTFDAVNRTLVDSADLLSLWNVRAVHNVYLGWLEQAGLIGAAPMFACIAALVVATARRGLRRSRSMSLVFALLGVDVVFMVHGISDFALEMFGVAALWTYLLGLQFSLSQGSSAR